MTIRIFVLPTQYDIIDFRQGRRPENILVRDFAGAIELQAYENGIDAILDQYDRIEDLAVSGLKVVYTRRSEDPEAEAVAHAVEIEFATPAELAAYCKGLEDAEGYAAPLLVDDADDRCDQLLAWSAAS
ncbi:MAG: hypothetical protein ACM3X0_03130 [Bacteroidota bacterium]